MSTQTFGKYQMVKKLATGGMAEVWLAKQTGIEGFNRHVVIKRILPHLAEDPEFVQMFLNEARVAARFNHPNIAQIYDLGTEHGTYFIAMEFIHGEDLGRVMRRAWSTGQWVARHIALRIVADAASALYYAHARTDEHGQPLRVVHRDISPQNILISFDGSVKVVDFGIAKAADQVSSTKSGAIKGKFAYMAPEQAAGKPLDGRTDIFALGLVLYELVTGVRPLKRDSELATLQAALEGQIEPPSAVIDEVPPELDELVMRALARAPDDRYRDAREFQKAIEQYLLESKELATSAEVSDLMETLFAARRAEEARLGAPNPSTESSTSNPIPPSYAPPPSVTHPPALGEEPGARARLSATMDAGADEEEPTSGTEEDLQPVSLRGGYALPAGTVVPSRRYVGREATSAARSSPPEATRAEEPEGEPAPRPSRQLRRKPASALATPPPGDDEAPRRRGTGQLKRRSSASAAMPEAPPRRASAPAAVEVPQESKGDISKLVDVQSMKDQQRARLKALVSVLALVAAVVLVVVFRDSLLGALKRDGLAVDGVPILLSVRTSPPTVVTVLPPSGSTGRQPMELGAAPLERVSGAFVGDTILLTNDDRGIRFRETIDQGQPNDLKQIEKEFKEVTLKVMTRPPLRSAEVWRGNARLGQVGVSIQVFPGEHVLEVRSAQLTEPVTFELTIPEGQRQVTHPLDVSAALEPR